MKKKAESLFFWLFSKYFLANLIDEFRGLLNYLKLIYND